MSKNTLMTRLCIFLIALALLPIGTVSAGPNTILKLASLYESGHPVTEESGQIVSLAATEHGLLFVSFLGLTDEFGDKTSELHIWDITDAAQPELLSALDFSDPGDRPAPDDPSLLAPDKLQVIKNHLVFWRNYELYSYRIEKNGALTEVFKGDFADNLNQNLNRPESAGFYATSERQLLTNNEFLNLIDELGFQEAEDRLYEHVLINIQDPERPFLVRQEQVAGKQLRIFDPAPTGAFDGLPARVTVSEDRRTLSLLRYSQLKEEQLSRFWRSGLVQRFGQRTLRMNLSRFTNALLDRLDFQNITERLNVDLGKFSGLPKGVRLRERLEILPPDQALHVYLASLGISFEESLELALEKLILSFIDERIETRAKTLLIDNLLEEYVRVLFGTKVRSLKTAAKGIQKGFAKDLEELGWDRYFMRYVLEPLIGSPAPFRSSLSLVIRNLSNSPFGQLLSGALAAYHAIIPSNEILRASFQILGIPVPRCLTLPQSTQRFFELLLVESGPRLDLSNFAFLELLKLTLYYSGDRNYAQFLRELRGKVTDLRRALAQDLTTTLLQGLDTFADIDSKMNEVLERVAAQFDVRGMLARTVVAELSQYLENEGIDISLSLREILEERGIYGEIDRVPEGASLATNSNLVAAISEFSFANKQVRIFLQVGAEGKKQRARRQRPLRSELSSLVQNLWVMTFGEASLGKTLEAALADVITQRMTTDITANFIEDIIGEMLSNIHADVPLPSLLSTVELAAQGNCIAQLRLALTAISGIVGPQVLTAEIALGEAQEYALEYILRYIFQYFLEQIFEQSDEHYPSWDLKLSPEQLNINLESFQVGDFEHVDPFLFRDKIALVFRDLSFGGWSPGLSRSVELALASPSDIPASLKRLSVGDWDSLEDPLSTPGGFLFLAGNRLDSEGLPQPGVVLLDTRHKDELLQYELLGEDAEELKNTSELLSLNSRNIFVARTIGGQVLLFSAGL